MKTLFAVMTLTLSLFLVGGLGAGDKGAKEVKLVGKICCAKCELGETPACATVIVAKDKKVYYFDAASHKKFHSEICTECKEGSVTGTVSKEGKKNQVKVKDLEFKK